MKDLDALLSESEPEGEKNNVNNVNDNLLDSLHITRYAFEKAFAYARLTCKVARRGIECGGYLITPKDSVDRIARDAFLAKNQDVSAGLFTIYGEDVIMAGREINEMGYKVLGWWHSHGYGSTFFSSIDNNGQRTVLNEIAPFNYIPKMEEKDVENLEVRVEDGRLVIFDRKNPERKFHIETNGSGNISVAKLKIHQEQRVGFAYGLVVNAWKKIRQPYSEIATREFCGFCRNSNYKSVPAGVTLFEDGDFVIDEDALRREIKERVKTRSAYFFGYGKGRRKKLRYDSYKDSGLGTYSPDSYSYSPGSEGHILQSWRDQNAEGSNPEHAGQTSEGHISPTPSPSPTDPLFTPGDKSAKDVQGQGKLFDCDRGCARDATEKDKGKIKTGWKDKHV